MAGFVRWIGVEVSDHDGASEDQINAGSDLPTGRYKLLVGAVKAVAGLVVVHRIDAAAEVHLLRRHSGQRLLCIMGECVVHWSTQRGIGGQINFYPWVDLSHLLAAPNIFLIHVP